MEDVKNQQSSAAAIGKSKLRYPLRSNTKAKQENKSPDTDKNFTSSAPKSRGRLGSNMSKSVSVLDISGKDKSAKPPRRLSIPAKSTENPHQKNTTNVTPISEAKLKRNDTPLSDVSKSSNRRKFSVLSSASYWLSQIKLSESAAKHSISLGFFKLALEAGCEPLQRLKDELKAYVRRHNLTELEQTLKELFESYEISESPEELRESGTQSDEAVHGTNSTTATKKLNPKSLNVNTQSSSVKDLSKKENARGTTQASKIRTSVTRSSVNVRSATGNGASNVSKNVQNGKDKIKKQEKKSTNEEAPVTSEEETLEENKENMDAPLIEEISMAEEN